MASANIGPKRLVVGAHYGLRAWLAQRITAVLMALYAVVVGVYAVFFLPAGYEAWARLFVPLWMKIATLVVILALIYHVWVGMREIFMDYIKPTAIRLALYVFVILWLAACAAWSVQILWSV
ncbi:MAG: succinate dehydrogenase, hydrophobic membrane anchor protein [Betaproteobacteria bacterium]